MPARPQLQGVQACRGTSLNRLDERMQKGLSLSDCSHQNGTCESAAHRPTRQQHLISTPTWSWAASKLVY